MLRTLVDATDIHHWADRLDARARLPMLLRRLIHATVKRIDRIGFPAEEGVQLGGWDGIVVVENGNAFVPDGCSVWELGVNRNVKGKADDDYEKRRQNPLDLDPSKATFVFVTSRRWGAKDKWIRERNKDGFWREVRSYDADDIVPWMELAPAVHIWLSMMAGKHPEAAIDIGSFWTDWSEATQPFITPTLLTAGREEVIQRIQDWLADAPASLALRSDTREEVVAFLGSMLHQLSPEDRLPYLSRTVIVNDSRAWQQLAAADSGLLIVPMFDIRDSVVRAIRNGNHVFIPLGGMIATPKQQ